MIKNTPMNTTITSGSLELLLKLANDAGNWGGSPMLPYLTPEEKGYLTALKRAKLLYVDKDEGVEFVHFQFEQVTVTYGDRTVTLTRNGRRVETA